MTRFHDIAVSGTMKTFDLSNVEFARCWFEGTEFRNCIFSSNTSFLGCSFDGSLEFNSCVGSSEIAVRDAKCSREAEYVLATLKQTGVREETKRVFAEDALSRALRKFKGGFGFDSIQYRHRKTGFKPGNPYNEKVWDVLFRHGIVERHHLSNVDEGGLNIVDDKDVRRDIVFLFDNGVLGRTLQNVLVELIK